jgi:hypothetical protein
MLDHKNILKWLLITLAVVGVAMLYYWFDPAQSRFFPGCAFKTITGYDCPGCGSQRSIHHLLHFNLTGALKANLLLVLAIPYVLTGFITDAIQNPSARLRTFKERFYGKKAIWTGIAVIVIFWIIRNLFSN